jgi:mRNA interferase HigB
VNVISKATLRSFWNRHPQARGPLEAWIADVRHASWNSPADVKAHFGTTVDYVADNRVIFDIAGKNIRSWLTLPIDPTACS